MLGLGLLATRLQFLWRNDIYIDSSRKEGNWNCSASWSSHHSITYTWLRYIQVLPGALVGPCLVCRYPNLNGLPPGPPGLPPGVAHLCDFGSSPNSARHGLLDSILITFAASISFRVIRDFEEPQICGLDCPIRRMKIKMFLTSLQNSKISKIIR